MPGINSIDNDNMIRPLKSGHQRRDRQRLCVAGRCGRVGTDFRTAIPGYLLCRICRDRLETNLAALPGIYHELEEAMSPYSAAVETVRGNGNVGLPLNEYAIAARTSIRTRLVAWARLVIGGRGVRRPEASVPALSAFLGRHVDWLAGNSVAGDVADDIDSLVGRGRRAARPSTARRIPIGPCVEPDCDGTLTALVDNPGDSAPSRITCDTDERHHWPLERWHALNARLQAENPLDSASALAPGLTAADIAANWKIPTGTVYWLAKVHQWRRQRFGRSVYYESEDVIKTLDRQTS